MNLIAALGYVLGILIFAWIIRRKRAAMIKDRMNKMKAKQQQTSEKEK